MPHCAAALVRSLFVLVVALAALPADAQITFVAPTGTPTTNDVVLARIQFLLMGSCGSVTPTTVVNGTTIRTDVAAVNCQVLQPFLASSIASIGPLPAGTYTYEAYLSVNGGPPMFAGSTTLVVLDAPMPVPALTPTALVVLVMVFALVPLRQLS